MQYTDCKFANPIGIGAKLPLMKLIVTGGSGFIGANLIAELADLGGYEVLNVDIAQPSFGPSFGRYFQCDLLDQEKLNRCFEEFTPTFVVHLAGRTDMFGVNVEDYASNYIGTQNIIKAIQRTTSVRRVIFTSSQYVVGPGPLPENDQDYRPHTIYGESKVLSEQVVHGSELPCSWTIIRPTNIWGRWHPRYPNEFWRVLKRGLYMHPGGAPVRRCYGYVGNIIDQILRILILEGNDLDGKTLYVGDPPIDIYDWTNAFSLELTGKSVRVVPRGALAALAKLGDAIKICYKSPPISSSRFRSMTEDYVTPMGPTFEALGPPKYSIHEGVKKTVNWLRSEDDYWL